MKIDPIVIAQSQSNDEFCKRMDEVERQLSESCDAGSDIHPPQTDISWKGWIGQVRQ